VYARGTCPKSGATERLFETQVPIVCGGVTVQPGDILFGDEDGIIVGSFEQFAAAIPVAEAIRDRESQVLADIAVGGILLEMLNVEQHVAAVREGKPSKLVFKERR
jgi:regulator of RNase E activity RraA